MKFCTKTDSNMSNSMVIFFLFQMQNSVVVFTFSVLDRKQSFWLDLVQKFNTVSLSGSLVLRLT